MECTNLKFTHWSIEKAISRIGGFSPESAGAAIMSAKYLMRKDKDTTHAQAQTYLSNAAFLAEWPYPWAAKPAPNRRRAVFVELLLIRGKGCVQRKEGTGGLRGSLILVHWVRWYKLGIRLMGSVGPRTWQTDPHKYWRGDSWTRFQMASVQQPDQLEQGWTTVWQLAGNCL